MQIRHARSSDEASLARLLEEHEHHPRACPESRRVIWTTGEHNEGARRFYDRLSMRQKKKVYYVMEP